MSGKTFVFPMSPAQKSLWLFEKTNYLATSSPYNSIIALRLSGALNVAALKESIAVIFTRHESLKTTFGREGEKYYQIIHEDMQPSFDVLHLPEEKLDVFIREKSEQGFNLEEGPLSRFYLLETKAQTYTLVVIVHHIIFDGWSSGIFVKELSAIYNSLTGSDTTFPPASGIQYADYAVWKEKNQQEQANAALAYWVKNLEGANPYLNFPFYKDRDKIPSYRGRSVRFSFDDGLVSGLKDFCDGRGISHFAVFAAVYATLLYWYTGQEDLVIPVPLAGREDRKELENIIGVFVNMLPVRIRVNRETPFMDLILQVQERMTEILDHQQIDIQTLQEHLNFRQHTMNASLFNCAFSHINVEFGNLSLNNVTVSYLHYPRNASRRDLTFFIYENRQTFFGEIEYSTELFQQEQVQRLIKNYTKILTEVLQDIDRKVKDIPFLDNAEQRLLLDVFNDTETIYPVNSSITALFERQVQLHPDKEALYYEGRYITYLEVNTIADQLAEEIINTGLTDGEIIPVMTGNPLRMVIGILAVLKAGKAYMPIDPVIPQERAFAMISDSGCSVILTDKLTQLPVTLSLTSVEVFTDVSHARPLKDRLLKASGDSLCYVMYTSGSTGKPKGVKVLHRNVVRLVQGQDKLTLTSFDNLLQTAPFSFDASTLEIWGTLLNGATLFLTRKENILTASSLRSQLQRFKITALWLTAPLFGEMAGIDPGMFESLRYLIVGGDVIPVAQMNTVRTVCSQPIILNGYGPTENTTFSTIYRIDNTYNRSIPIGMPVSNSSVYILNEALQLLPLGAIGTLYAGGDGLSAGYLHDDELTARRFIPHPFKTGERLYDTGDLAMWQTDGNLLFIGRRDKQIKINGFRIEPGEIEHTLMLFPGIRQAFVRLYKDKLLAYVVTEEKELIIEDLKAWLKERLLTAMIPEVIIRLESLPLTHNGKVDEVALPLPAEKEIIKSDVVAGSTIAIITQIWENSLEVAKGTISVEDSFFEIGGHSILAVQLISEVEKVFNLEIDMVDFFENDTIRLLSEFVDSKVQLSPAVVIERVTDREYYPLSAGQRRLWVLEQIRDGKGAYNIYRALKLNGKIDVGVLSAALLQLTQRHEILRTRFVYVKDEICQQVMPEVAITQILDVTAAGQVSSIDEYIEGITNKVFDLTQLPLFKLYLLRLSEVEHILIPVFHHIISDEWSNKVFIRELTILYNSGLKQENVHLEVLPIQYRDYAIWSETRSAEKESEDEQYWLKQLGGTLPQNEFPYKPGVRTAFKTFGSAAIQLDLSQEIAVQLQEMAASENVSLFMVLLAGLNVLTARYTGDDDILVGVPVSGRDHIALERQLGFYVNTVVMRNKVHLRQPFSLFLQEVKEQVIAAFRHSSYPFNKLVESIGLRNDVSRAPIFELMLGMLEDDALAPLLTVDGVVFEHYPVHQKKSPFDLIFNARRQGHSINLELIYNVQLFDQPFACQLLEDYSYVLSQVALNKKLLIENILFSGIAQGKVAAPGKSVQGTIVDHFIAQVRTQADKPALIAANGTISYLLLWQQAVTIGQGLQQEYNVLPGDAVGVMFTQPDIAIPAILGILAVGGVYVPLNPEEKSTRLQHMIPAVDMKVLLTDDAEAVHKIPASCKVIAPDSFKQDGRPDFNVPVNETNTAYIIYTSGSTGIPKGVQVSHKNVLNLVQASNYHSIQRDSNMLQFAPLYFDGSVFEIFGALLNGATLHILEKDKGLNALALADFITTHGINTAFLTTAFFNSIVETCPHIISSFEKLYFGGETASVNNVRSALKYQKKSGALVHVYGPTETTVFSTYHPLTTLDEDAVNVPIGLPVSGVSAYILDGNLQPVPLGVMGELYIGGAGVSKGYLHEEALNKEKFISSPFEEGEIIYRTGDLARYDHQGMIVFAGRKDSQIKLRGHRIELEDIETAILAVAGVYEAKVVALKENKNVTQLLAYWAGADNCTNEEVIHHLLKSLPGYMIPAVVKRMIALPLNANGKIDEAALLSIAADNEGQGIIPLGSDLEKKIAGIWSHFLHVNVISAASNFFETGGHSLTAMKVAAAIYNDTGVNIPLKDMYLHPTVQEMSNYIQASRWLQETAKETSLSANDNIMI